MWRTTIALLSLPCFLIGSPARADIITTLNSTQDNTLIQVASSALASQLSNGSGPQLFIGRTAQDGSGPATISIRRGLVLFDLSSIPAGSLINSVSLSMVLINGNQNTAETINVQRVLEPWGSGGSSFNGGSGAPAEPPDATWYYSMIGTTPQNSIAWTNPGGDFSPTISASLGFPQTTNTPGTSYSWSGAGLTQDVQNWVDGVMPNDGWGLLGNEAVGQTARSFATLNASPDYPYAGPSLIVDYTPAPEPAGLCLLSFGMIAIAGLRYFGNPVPA